MTGARGSSVAALLLAAGAGDRLGEPVPKAFVSLAGRPMFDFSLQAMVECGAIQGVVLVVPEAQVDRAGRLVGELGAAALVRSIVAGGATRQESVRLGLRSVGPTAGVVVCHDAARPFASPDLYRRVVDRLRADDDEPPPDGVVPVVPTPDTVKVLREGWVDRTIPRQDVGLAQTPQAFVLRALQEAHHLATGPATDDAMLLETAGFRVAVVEGEASNFKITSPADLDLAERVLREGRMSRVAGPAGGEGA